MAGTTLRCWNVPPVQVAIDLLCYYAGLPFVAVLETRRFLLLTKRSLIQKDLQQPKSVRRLVYRRFIQRFQQDRCATHLNAQDQPNRHPIKVVVVEREILLHSSALGQMASKSNEKSSKAKNAEHPTLGSIKASVYRISEDSTHDGQTGHR